MSLLGKSIFLLALMVWVGEIVFFSFVVAPAVFRTLPTQTAGQTVGAIFPIYYAVGYVCGALLLLACGGFLLQQGTRAWWGVVTGLVTVMLAATLYAGIVIQPRASALKPQMHSGPGNTAVRQEFDRLHGRAVQLNSLVLLCGIAACVLTAAKMRP
jgi:uncharacterized membrane protein